MLHVTNGDNAVARLREANLAGDVLPWRDALHEGPVRAGLDPAALRAERARFIAARGWAEENDVLADLEARDARLERALSAGAPIVLWFESDLHDVLQLAQIADRLLSSDDVRAVLVGTTTFRGVAELAWTTDGLNRSERALRDALAGGARTREEAFMIAQRQEERPFLGDAIAFDYLEHQVCERWLGGVHLPPGDAGWRYDPATRSVAV